MKFGKLHTVIVADNKSLMDSRFRLVFRTGLRSTLLQDDQLRSALSRSLGLSEAEYEALRIARCHALPASCNDLTALECLSQLQKLGLEVMLEQPRSASETKAETNWLSASGFASGFERTDLDMQRAEALLQNYPDDTGTRSGE